LTINHVSNEALKNAIEAMKGKQLKVGWNESAQYEKGGHVAGIAAQNEFGNPAKNIPARPFMRPTIAEYSGQWSEKMNMVSKQVIKGAITPNSAMEIFGDVVAGDIRKTISEVTSPPLKASTVQARRRKMANGKGVSTTIDKPLIDSAVMFNTLTSEVTK